jgi:hypothetical protein
MIYSNLIFMRSFQSQMLNGETRFYPRLRAGAAKAYPEYFVALACFVSSTL